MANEPTHVSLEGKAFLDALDEFEKSTDRLRQIRAMVRAVAEQMDHPDRWAFQNSNWSGPSFPLTIPYDASEWPTGQELADAQSRWVAAHRKAIEARLLIPEEEKDKLPRVPLLQI
jgi:hypothetical protein